MQPQKTALYEVHKSLGAKIIEFAGYRMPIQYEGILQEHRRVRSTVGIFDVSHMGEFEIRGEKALEYLQLMTINDVSRLSICRAQYSAMCYEDGGLVDDLILYRFPDHYMMVVNAANRYKDFQWMKQHLISGVKLEDISNQVTLLAIQGRYSQAVLQKLTPINLSEIKYYWFQEGLLADTPMTISRTGYTGEDGFELYLDAQSSEKVWHAVMEAGAEFQIEPIGLGARDTLRLEMKYCLYGNDIDHTTNPLEAGLGWITKLEKGDFIGREALLKVKEQGIVRRLVGFVVEGKAFPRKGYRIFKDGNEIGWVTSGTFSPMLEKCIGLGYVKVEYSEIGKSIDISIRGQEIPALICKTPFYQRPY